MFHSNGRRVVERLRATRHRRDTPHGPLPRFRGQRHPTRSAGFVFDQFISECIDGDTIYSGRSWPRIDTGIVPGYMDMSANESELPTPRESSDRERTESGPDRDESNPDGRAD